MRVLVVGSTGYIGVRLVDELLRRGYVVKAAFRSPHKIEKKPWYSHPNLVPVKANVFDTESLIDASNDCEAAYYLVHSMYGKGDFAALDKEAALNMSRAAERSGLKRLIYLGGLGNPEGSLSKHLNSRMEVSRIFHQSAVPTTTLRAAMVVGAGSASFEIMRYLVDRLPAMVTPRWVRTKSQPIAVSNVIGYLIDSLEEPATINRVLDIGGPDILSYHDLMRIYEEVAGLKRRFIVPLPLLTPRLSSYWLSLVTPLPTPLAKALIEGLKNEAVCQNNDAQSIIPQKLLSIREAIQLVLEENRHQDAVTKSSLLRKDQVHEWTYEGDPHWAGGSSFWMAWRIETKASRQTVWNAIHAILGTKGWNYGSWFWPLRGYVDVIFRGMGMVDTRTRPHHIQPGSIVDCWEILRSVPERYLSLKSTLRMPAEVLLTIRLKNADSGGCETAVRLYYRPHGFAGLVAWFGLLSIRRYAVGRLLDRIIQVAESQLINDFHSSSN